MTTKRRVLLIEVETERGWSSAELQRALNEGAALPGGDEGVIVYGQLDLADFAATIRKARQLSAEIENRRPYEAMQHSAWKLLAYLTERLPAQIRGRVDPARHNHLTRDIKARGKCPACDVIHDNAAASATV